MDYSRNISLTPSPTHQADRSGSPNKRLRNAKGLSINTTGISTRQPPHTAFAGQSLNRLADPNTASIQVSSTSRILSSTASTLKPQHSQDLRPFSEPSSPSFIVPSILPPKRSKLGLTITTSDPRGGQLGGVPQTPLRSLGPLPLRTRASDLTARLNTVPETPGYYPLSAMREGEEGKPLFSPSMAPNGGMQLPPFGSIADPTLPTPGFGPEGGMRLPGSGSSESSPYARSTRPPLSLPRNSFETPLASSVVQHTIEHNPSTPLHELPLSREAKTPGYPDGPICIYPPSVFLYHQPTREEARQFDVIINVAKEVTNPFLEPEEPKKDAPVQPRYRDAGVQCTILPGPEKAPEPVPASAASDISFTSAFESLPDDDGPETPKASSPKPANPEYIHLPWEHNSKVYEEWLRVCEIIDKRVQQGKRVLIHCQLGVSRSASLIVAYGIYKDPSLSPDEAREQAKKQSRFIDLNMHFMYELGDFKKLLAEKAPALQVPRRPGGTKGLSRTMTDSALASTTHSRNPMSPIVDEEMEGDSINPKFANVPTADFAGPGPSSAPVPAPKEYQDSQSESVHTSIPEQLKEVAASQNAAVGAELQPEEPLPLQLPTARRVGAEKSATTSSQPPRPTLELSLASPTSGLTLSNLTLAQPPRPVVENQAKNTESLPPPNLDLPNLNTNLGSSSRRTIRPVPSLPAGFNSLFSRRPEQPSFPLSSGLSLNIPPSTSAIASQANAGDEILSPRVAEFTATPFHRTTRSMAGDLAEPSTGGLLSPRDHARDPRSPPAKGEVTVLRNIDDILG